MSVHFVFFVPVGTSSFSNLKIEKEEYPTTLGAFAGVSALPILFKKTIEQSREEHNKSRTMFKKQDDAYPAEIASLYCFFKERTEEFADKDVHIILLHSDGVGEVCAQFIENLIIKNNGKLPTHQSLNKIPFFDKIRFSVTHELLPGLDPDKTEGFSKAMESLADIISRECASDPEHIYLNITGGYKAVGPYLTMMGMALGTKVTVFYLFEDSSDIVVLPTYPLAFDALTWRDWRGLLFPLTEEMGLTTVQKEKFAGALAGTKVAGLITKSALNPIGKIMHSQYQQGQGTQVSQFGEGSLLLDSFTAEGACYRDYLQNRCIPIWRHLAAGDHIPETVEHGRGHVQRLLELAEQLLIAANIALSVEQRFVLVGSIWLHDLGHSGDSFSFEGKSGLVQNKDDKCSTGQFPVYGDPDHVRRYHNFLSYDLIKNHRTFLFPCGAGEKVCADVQAWQRLLRSIELACLYHRRKMPVQGEAEVEGRCLVAKGIQDFAEGNEVVDGFPLVVALLRLLDGAENQEERTGSQDFYDVMSWVIDRQTRFLKSYAKSHPEEARILREAKFKEIQKGHYNKHRLIRNVFFVQEDNDTPLCSEGIYGPQDGKTCIIGTYIVGNTEQEGYNQDLVMKEIIKEFLEEYEAVISLLPFKLAIILIENECRYQAIVTKSYFAKLCKAK